VQVRRVDFLSGNNETLFLGISFGSSATHTTLLPVRLIAIFPSSEGQHLLFGPVFLPRFAHESRRLLALPCIPLAGYRSGLRSPLPAWPIGCSAFRHWSASISLPTA
jgi:hypothetical protein